MLVIGAAFYLVAFSTVRLVGDALFEIETDKVVNQIEASEDGVLDKQLFEEGDTVEVGTAVGLLKTDKD